MLLIVNDSQLKVKGSLWVIRYRRRMLTGPNFAAQEAMLNAGKFNVIASGGVSRREDVVKLAELARRYANLDGVIVGKALYEKRVELSDLLEIAR